MRRMIERVLLVAWKGSPAAAWADTIRSGGFTVLVEETTGERAWRTAKERGIDCVIIDGLKKPSHGRQTGFTLRDTAKTRGIPIIWTNLNIEDAANVAADVQPDIALTQPTTAAEALSALRSLSPRVTPALPRLTAVAPPAPPAPVIAAPAPTTTTPKRDPETKVRNATKTLKKSSAAKKPVPRSRRA